MWIFHSILICPEKSLFLQHAFSLDLSTVCLQTLLHRLKRTDVETHVLDFHHW